MFTLSGSQNIKSRNTNNAIRVTKRIWKRGGVVYAIGGWISITVNLRVCTRIEKGTSTDTVKKHALLAGSTVLFVMTSLIVPIVTLER